MQKTVRRTLAAAALSGLALLGTSAPALAAQSQPAAPDAGSGLPELPALPQVPLPELPKLPALTAVPDVPGLTTITGPAGATGKLTDLAPGGVPIAGTVNAALSAPKKLGLPGLPKIPGVGG